MTVIVMTALVIVLSNYVVAKYIDIIPKRSPPPYVIAKISTRIFLFPFSPCFPISVPLV
jgi:hypothetical protein